MTHMAPRHFRNTLPDYPLPPTTPAPADASLTAAVSVVPRSSLQSLFQETLDAVLGYRTSNPTIYTGLAGVAYSLWHARRALLRTAHHQPPLPDQPATAAAAAPAGPADSSALAASPPPTETTADSAGAAAAASAAAASAATILPAALERCRTAAAALTSGPRGIGLTRGSRAASMLDGAAGVHMTAALVLHDAAAEAAAAAAEVARAPPLVGAAASTGPAAVAAALRRERDDHVRSYLDAYPAAMDSENDEFLYGRAGYLQGCNILNVVLGPGTVPDEVAEGVATEMLESGRELAGRLRWRRTDTPRPPLFYMWPGGGEGEPYLGGAHGLMGILFSLLHVRPVVRGHEDELRASLAYVASHETDAAGCTSRGGHYPTRMAVSPEVVAQEAREGGGGGGGGGGGRKVLVHWCHGSPGAVLMWCKAYEVYGEPSYLAAAQRAGEVVWQLGLLRKGHGLCHGTSGNAYALLALHRATRHPAWLARARHFAVHIGTAEGRSVYDTPDRPLSLFEGRAGALCLLADLTAPDGGAAVARFPAVELPYV